MTDQAKKINPLQRALKWPGVVGFVQEEVTGAFDCGRGMSKSELKSLLEVEFGLDTRDAEATALALAESDGADWAVVHLGSADGKIQAYANWLRRTLERLRYSALKRKKNRYYFLFSHFLHLQLLSASPARPT